MIPLLPVLLFLAFAASACFAPPTLTAPSRPRGAIKVAGVSFTVTATTVERDFSPRVLDPGPDGGGALTGTMSVRAVGPGGDSDSPRFSVAAALYDQRGERHPLTAVPRLADRPALWDGTVAPGQSLDLEVALGNGPYLEAGTPVFVVLRFTSQGGDHGTLRTTDLEVLRGGVGGSPRP